MIVADVLSEQDRATALFRLGAVVILAEMVAIPLGGALMMLGSPWVPFVLGLIILITGVPLAAFALPETLPKSSSEQTRRAARGDQDEDEAPPKPSNPPSSTHLSYRLRAFLRAIRFLAQSDTLLALTMFLASSLSRQSTSLLLQYSFTRYHWTITRASVLLSVRGIITFVVFLILMPALSTVLTSTVRIFAMQKAR